MKQGQQGFTILELTIATTVFAVMLLLSLTAIARIGQMYYKGISTAQTQDVARLVSNNVNQAVQLNSGLITAPIGGSFCIGDTRYSYAIDTPVSGSQHALWSDKLTNCANVPHPALNLATPNPGGTEGYELLGQKMRLSSLTFAPIAGTDLYRFAAGIVFGDDEVLNATHTGCTRGYTSAQFCAISSVDTTIQKRL